MRQHLVDALEVTAGHRVLELGCGTGQVTALLVAAGADVVAVDALPGMLDGARRRAPGATFIQGDVFDVEIADRFDRVVLAFVPHNFDAHGRVDALRRSASVLAPGGRVGILDWATPPGRTKSSLWRRCLTRLEPSSNVSAVLDGTLGDELCEADLDVREHRSVAGGRAQVLIAAPSTDRVQAEIEGHR